MSKPLQNLKVQIEAAFRHVEEALRRGDPDTLAGRMPKEWREREAARLAADHRRGAPAAKPKKRSAKPAE